MGSPSPFTYTDDVRHLNVPVQPAPEGAEEFPICCLYSVIEYFANWYPDDGIRRGTDRPTMDDLRDIFITDEGGWRPKQGRLTELGSIVRTIQFSVDQWPVSAPMELSSIVNEHIGRFCPVIAFVDGLKIREDSDVAGPIYSVIVAGQSQGKAVIIDPWDGRKRTVKNQKLEAAWDEEMHQVIMVRSSDGPIQTGGSV